MKIKVISDGTQAGTKVLNAETGESIPGVTGVVVHADAWTPQVTAVITFSNVEIEVYADAEIFEQRPDADADQETIDPAFIDPKKWKQ